MMHMIIFGLSIVLAELPDVDYECSGARKQEYIFCCHYKNAYLYARVK